MGRVPSRMRELLEGKFWMLYLKMDKDIFTQHLVNMPIVCLYSVSWDTKLRLTSSPPQMAPCPVMDTQVNHSDAGRSVYA